MMLAIRVGDRTDLALDLHEHRRLRLLADDPLATVEKTELEAMAEMLRRQGAECFTRMNTSELTTDFGLRINLPISMAAVLFGFVRFFMQERKAFLEVNAHSADQ